jgi:hypothetical protein
MRKTLAIGMVIVMILMILTTISPTVAADTTIDYVDILLSGDFQAGHFDHIWDLTACDLVLSFTYDGNGLVDDYGGDAHAWAELGVRAVGYGDFNPTWGVDGAGVWLATDYDWTVNTFDPDSGGAPIQDLDDKLILQKGGGKGEGDYNLPSTPPNPWANHAVWFDRDGVDQWQAQMWSAIDGVTYNTDGTYDVVITLHATSATAGEAYMTINGEPQGFYDPGWHSGAADLYPAGMTFTGDMERMQVFYGLSGYGAMHSVAFKAIRVEGCLFPPLSATIDIDPDTLNVKSHGEWITAYIELPEGYDVNDIDVSTIYLLDSIPVDTSAPATVGDYDSDGISDLMVKFVRTAVVTELGTEDVTEDATEDETGTDDYEELTITGELTDETPFGGSDMIRVIDKGKSK